MLISLIFTSMTAWAAAGDRDLYPNFGAMAAERTEGVDFKVETADRGSHIGVIAIHGGIEPMSEDIARAIADQDFNLYVFESLVDQGRFTMHVTSTHFDDPRAVALMNKSRIAISIHGYKATREEVACVGGGNEALRDWVAQRLSVFVKVESPCAIFNGRGRANIVNQAAEQGVQLELSRTLRARLKAEPDLYAKFIAVLRDAMTSFPCDASLTRKN